MGHFRLRRALRRLRRELRAVRFIVSRPGLLRIMLVGEQGMAIQFAIQLPAPPELPSDWAEIVGGELTVVLPNIEPIVIQTSKAVQEVGDRLIANPLFVAPQGTNVQANFRYIDDAGNRSVGVEIVATLADTFPPVAPQAIGLVVTGEVPD